MLRATLVASLLLCHVLVRAEATPAGPRTLRWTFANHQAITAVLSGDKPGVYWGDSPKPESIPLVPGVVREISPGNVRAVPDASGIASREPFNFSDHRAVMVAIGENIFVISKDRKITRLDLLRPPKISPNGNVHVSRVYRDDPLGKETLVLNVQWTETLQVGSKTYWGETHLVRDDGVSVRFGVLESVAGTSDPQVIVKDDVLEVKGITRQLDLRKLEQEATVATGIASRASDAAQTSLDGWTRATELFNPLHPEAESPQLDEGANQVISQALKSLTRGRRSVVLRGKVGVGKQTLAKQIVSGLPRTWTVFHLTPDGIDSGSALTGNFSARLLAMKAASETKPVVWFMPNVHAFRDLGTHSKKDTDFFDGMLAEMKSGTIRILGTAQDEQYASLVRGRADLGASFDIVPVEDAPELRVAHIAGDRIRKVWIGIQIEDYHQLRAWGQRFAPRMGEPGRTIELVNYALDEAAARESRMVEMRDIHAALQRRYTVPLAYLDHDLAVDTIATLERELQHQLPGNDEARDKIVGAARAALFDLRAPNRPVATGLFAGPRGAGKTALVELFAKILGLPVLPLAMSSYSGEWTVREFQKAFGEFADAHPVGIIFLDELEKSAPKVQDTLLKALESNAFTYSNENGLQTVPMANLIILGATNAGQDMVTMAAKNGRSVAPAALRMGVIGELSQYLVDRFNFVEPVYPSNDEVYRSVVRSQVEQAISYFGIREDQIVNYPEMLDQLAKDRTAFGSNREADRSVFEGIGDAIGRMMSSKQIAHRRDLPDLRFHFEDGLKLECERALEGPREESKVIPFRPRARAS